ncbi:hypothetical protein [Deinococcus yunweiensis]|uniref:aspartate-alanine antiporter-like transporter n=1 Tax=Deinococcus yunweiensis TaxID=367282 RepID=UPI00398F5155
MAAIGFAVSRLRVAGFLFGVAAVLFVGLAFGATSPELRLPEVVYLLGLVLFVYTVGLASGPAFFRSLRRRELRDNALVLGIGAALAMAVYTLSGLLGKAAQQGQHIDWEQRNEQGRVVRRRAGSQEGRVRHARQSAAMRSPESLSGCCGLVHRNGQLRSRPKGSSRRYMASQTASDRFPNDSHSG